MMAPHPSPEGPSHLPNIYDSPYEQLFPTDQYGTQQFGQGVAGQLNHTGLVPTNATTQPWHHTYPQQTFTTISQPFTNQGHGYRPPPASSPTPNPTVAYRTTASPYQYGQFGNNYGHVATTDPSMGIDPNAMRQQQQSPYQMNVQNAPAQAQTGTVTPQALQQSLAVQSPRPTATSYQIPKTTAELFAQRAVPTFAKPVKNPEYEIPKGRKSGGFVVFDQAALAKATKSSALNKLVTFGSEPLHLPSNRTALPLYTPRQSVKDLKKVGAGNKKLLAKKSPTKSLSAGKALKRDVSDSESYDESSDDDSEYTDDEDDEPSPLPAVRPDEMHAATRYDIVKATWYPRRSQPSSEKIKASLRDVWEIVNTIQKRWRIDSKTVAEAEEQKKTRELPELKSRVTSQRDLLQSALEAALEHAHPDVLYHVGQVKPFLYLCYQFLANRFKMQDYDGGLSSAIYNMLSRCVGTLTTELLEETKVIKALNSMKKNVNEKNKALIQQIIEGAAAGSKKAKVSSPPEVESSAETKVAKRPAAQLSGRPTADTPAAKKLKSAELLANGEKKPSTIPPASKPTPSVAISQQKRPGEKAVTAPAKSRGNQVVNKPSTLFATLNAASKKPVTSTTSTSNAKSAAKPLATVTKDKKPTPAPSTKPAFSFAETMAQLLKPKQEEVVAPSKTEKQLPPETPEEKAKRLRRESRRHLRVTFRPDATLVSIKYFHHHPEEESGHDENFVRDAGDIGGEGRMFKQHKDMMDEDEDEDTEIEYRPWKEPSLVDFSNVSLEERQRNYEPYGGGLCKPSCPEKEANIRHENSTLMVFYSHSSDIPSSPREPLEQQTQTSPSAPVIQFGPPPELVTSRVAKPSTSTPTPDFSHLENIFKQFAAPNADPPQAVTNQSTYTPAPTVAAPTAAPDLASILSALNQGQPPAPAPIPFPTVPQPAAAPAVDISAIMAAISASAGNAAFAQPPLPPPPSWPTLPLTFPPPQTDSATYQPQPQPQPQSQSQSQSQPQPQQNQHTRGGHKRQREEGNDNDRGHGGKRNRLDRDRPHERPHGRPHKVVACRFFQKGTCNKGDDCTYIHDLNM